MSYSADVDRLRVEVSRRMMDRDTLKTTIDALASECDRLVLLEKEYEEAFGVLIVLGERSLQEAKEFFEKTLTKAVQVVFQKNYSFLLHVEQKRGQVECRISILNEKGKELDPRLQIGGGMVDLFSVTSRILFWYLNEPRSYPVIILDEPFKHLSPWHSEAASVFIKELSGQLKLQFIIVTHNNKLAAGADRVYEVSKDDQEDSIVCLVRS